MSFNLDKFEFSSKQPNYTAYTEIYLRVQRASAYPLLRFSCLHVTFSARSGCSRATCVYIFSPISLLASCRANDASLALLNPSKSCSKLKAPVGLAGLLLHEVTFWSDSYEEYGIHIGSIDFEMGFEDCIHVTLSK